VEKETIVVGWHSYKYMQWKIDYLRLLGEKEFEELQRTGRNWHV
jgi:hypothetical protein